MILDKFPSAEEFYKTYWGKAPFIVRGFIPSSLIDSLIDGDTLAGLALEDDIKSRIITNSAAGGDWVCEHGPFEIERFSALGEKNWSLLVQNVEQYHKDTAGLLSYFQFSPRWLMDDIMVSYSAAGGSVGPHTDSYHTFLVQGIGKRTWKISSERVNDDRYVDNPDVKVLAHGFEGESFEVEAGDVIYMPPFYGHEGKTLETAMTFSVGFLGPKLSEMLGDYAHHLEENDALNKRYFAEELRNDSAGFTVTQATQDVIRGDIMASVQSDDFARWMVAYFSTPSHEEFESLDKEQQALCGDEILYRPEYVKLAITPSSNGDFSLAVYGETISVSMAQAKLIEWLNDGQDIVLDDLKAFGDESTAMALIMDLYSKNALCVRGPARLKK